MYKITYTYDPLAATESIGIARTQTPGFTSIKTYHNPTVASKRRIFRHINSQCLSISIPLFGGCPNKNPQAHHICLTSK